LRVLFSGAILNADYQSYDHNRILMVPYNSQGISPITEERPQREHA
jgi:hypothetical protein